MDNLFNTPQNTALTVTFLILSVINIFSLISKKKLFFSDYLIFIWVYYCAFFVANVFSFYLSTWIWGVLCFFILREFFSLINFRINDRFGIIAAYLSIPFMMHFIHTGWYNMFVISIPVYSFLVIPYFVSLGGKDSNGAINSIGIIDFGLFLYVFCVGHIAFLSYYSIPTAALFVMIIIICDLVFYKLNKSVKNKPKRYILAFILPLPVTVLLSILVMDWTDISLLNSIDIGIMIPLLVVIADHTVRYLNEDIGISKDKLKPGRGLIIYSMKSMLFAAPVVFHFYRYFVL